MALILLALLGLVLVAAGAALIYPPAGLIVLGCGIIAAVAQEVHSQ